MREAIVVGSYFLDGPRVYCDLALVEVGTYSAKVSCIVLQFCMNQRAPSIDRIQYPIVGRRVGQSWLLAVAQRRSQFAHHTLLSCKHVRFHPDHTSLPL